MSWFASRTILFALVTGLMALATIFFKQDLSELAGPVTDALLALGIVYTTYRTIKGRFNAKEEIKTRSNPGGPFNPNAKVVKGERWSSK